MVIFICFCHLLQGIHSARLLYGALEVGKRMTVSTLYETKKENNLTIPSKN